ncbi:glycosyltransferase family 2 protein [Candidatus Pelagibacter sp.]|nr:glycosyltransferase family 2 protein [Candidatus Pelagibacter sp.]
MIFLILPAYNEKKNLIRMFKKLNNLKKLSRNITVILVDDCSRDKTQKLKKIKNRFKLIYLKHIKNMGLSYALQTGFKNIKNKLRDQDLIITMDSDNTHPIALIPKMIFKMKKDKSDIMIASRFLKNSKIKGLSCFRKALSEFAKIIFKFFFPYKNLTEYTCNYRIYRPFLIKKLNKQKNFFENEDFNIAAKILVFFIKNINSIRISEYPLTLSYQLKVGNSKMKVLKNIFLTLKLIIREYTKSK